MTSKAKFKSHVQISVVKDQLHAIRELKRMYLDKEIIVANIEGSNVADR